MTPRGRSAAPPFGRPEDDPIAGESTRVNVHVPYNSIRPLRLARKAIAAEVRNWRIHRKNRLELADLSRMFNPIIRGWVNYYGKYYPSELRRAFAGLNRRLVRWARRKYKRLRDHQRQATRWLRQLARQHENLFAHWKLGIVP